MASLYASLTGTTVLLQRHVPTQPLPAEQTADGSTAEDAEAAAALAAAWNGRAYAERGWTSFEQGVASMAALHMGRIVAQLERQRRTAPDAVRRAEECRPKLVDISDAALAPPCDAPSGAPVALLRAITRKIEGAAFTNNADRAAVAHMLFGLEWTMHVAIDDVLGRGAGRAGLTASPTARKARAARRGLPRLSSARAPSARHPSARDAEPAAGKARADGVQLLGALAAPGGDAAEKEGADTV